MTNNDSFRENAFKLMFLFLMAAFIYVVYLFALGFRYKTNDGYRVFDSWNQELLQVDPKTGGYKSVGYK